MFEMAADVGSRS
jgi:hypothetical protein